MTTTQFWYPIWLDHLSFNILKRSFLLALIIGGLLTLVNQYSALFSGDSLKVLPLVQVFLTPFGVITLSQLGATQQAKLDAGQTQVESLSGILSIMGSHNIPLRAALIAFVAVGINSVIAITNTSQTFASLMVSSWPLLAQSFVVPLFFGAFSQAMTYRRCLAF